MKTIHKIFALAMLVVGLAACEQQYQFTESIFVDPVIDTTTYTYKFDKWLDEYYTEPYNVEFLYKLDDNATDPNYNVVPVSIGMADTLAHLALYLWYDVYDYTEYWLELMSLKEHDSQLLALGMNGARWYEFVEIDRNLGIKFGKLRIEKHIHPDVKKIADFEEQLCRYSCFMCFAILASAAEGNHFDRIEAIRENIENSLHNEKIRNATFAGITFKSKISIFLMKKNRYKAAFYFLNLCKRIKDLLKKG